MSNGPRLFQAIVLESAYRAKRTTLENYIWKTLKIWDEYGLTDDCIVRLFSHIQQNLDKDVVKTIRNEYENIDIQLEHFLDNCWIDEDGNITEQAKDNIESLRYG